MSKRSVKLSLSPKAIEKFIKDELIDGLKIRAKEILDDILVELTPYGVDIVKSNIDIFTSELFSTGEMRESVMGYLDLSKGISIIRVNAKYGAFVEFGTGIVGKNRPSSQANEMNWAYDVNNHGDSGWIYKKNDEFIWTKGQAAAPFMSLSSVDIQKELERIIKNYSRGGK